MKLQELFESEDIKFDERLLRSLATDAGIDHSMMTMQAFRQAHQDILDQCQDYLNDPSMGYSSDDLGQVYYEVAKQYFVN